MPVGIKETVKLTAWWYNTFRQNNNDDDDDHNNNNNNKVTKSIKWSKSKELAGYIFACYTALKPSLPILAGFAVQNLLAVSLC